MVPMGLCKELDKNQTDLVLLLKPIYPKISKAAVSVAENPDESGVRFTAAAKKTAYRLTGRVERKPKRAHNNHLTIWVDDRQLRFLAHQPMAKGEYIRKLINEEMKRAATGATNTNDRM
jgi:hypothetical protein